MTDEDYSNDDRELAEVLGTMFLFQDSCETVAGDIYLRYFRFIFHQRINQKGDIEGQFQNKHNNRSLK